MLWRHDWGPPGTMNVTQAGLRTVVPWQECARCGTIRNPITGQIVRKARGSDCHRLPVEPPARDHSRLLRLLVEQLEFAEASGDRVDRDYGSTEEPVPELPLAYKT